jgi:hypothetical protein
MATFTAGEVVTAAKMNGLVDDIAYVEFASSVSVTGTTEVSSAQLLVSSGAITFDGAAVWVEFFCPYYGCPAAAGGTLTVHLWNDTTEVGRLFADEGESATQRTRAGGVWRRKIAPTAASHTITVRAHVSTGTGTIGAGTGTTTAYDPGYIRITKI